MYSKKPRAGELSLKMGITRSAATYVPGADSQKKEEELTQHENTDLRKIKDDLNLLKVF